MVLHSEAFHGILYILRIKSYSLIMVYKALPGLTPSPN